MKRNSVVLKLFLIMIGLSVVLILVATMFIKIMVENDIKEHIQNETIIVSQAVELALLPLLEKNDSELINKVITNLDLNEMIKSIRIHQLDGKVLYSTYKNEVGVVITSKPILDIVENPELGILTVNMENGTFVSVLPIIIDKESNLKKACDAVLYVEMDFKYTDLIKSAILKNLIVIMIFISAVFSFMIYWGMRKILGEPLAALNKGANEISKGHYDYRVHIDSNSEFKVLADAFNAMAENIETNTLEQKRYLEMAEQTSEARLAFLAKMSHEIRTPLNAIIGFSDLLAEELTDPQKKKMIDIIVGSGKHLLNLVNEVLDIAKIENNQMTLDSQPFSLRTLIGDIYGMLLHETEEKKILFSYEVDVQLPATQVGDAHRIRQILINVISNAVKFTEKGAVEILVSLEGDETVIKVKDTGIGISNESQEKIFNAYVQSDASIASVYGGTGLGLTISRRIARMMDGDITVVSNLNMGSTFSIRLKLEQLTSTYETGSQMVERWLYADSTVSDIVLDVLDSLHSRLQKIIDARVAEDVDALEFQMHSLKGVTGNFKIDEIYNLALELDAYLLAGNISYEVVDRYLTQIREVVKKIPTRLIETALEENDDLATCSLEVLLAEDVPENQLLIQQIMRSLPVRLTFANNGAEAITQLKKHKYDCLLLDMQMPVMNGEEVLAWLRSEGSNEDMYIVALTARAFKEDMDKFLELGAHWFLSKPVKKEVLRGKMMDLIQIKSRAGY